MRRHATVIGAVVSVVALAGVVWWASRQEPPDLPDSGQELAALLGAIVLYALGTAVRGERWHRLLEEEHGTQPRGESHRLNVVGYAVNNILPARAGDAVRVLLMAPRASIGRRAVIGTLLAERLLDVAVLLVVFVIVSLGVLGELGAGSEVFVIVSVVGALALAAVVLFVQHNQRAHELVAPILNSTLALRGPHGGRLLAMTLVIWALEAGVWMSAAAAVGFHMNPMEGLYLVALASVFALIPSGPAYAGTQDTAAILGATAVGASESLALSFLITVRFVLVVPITLVGVVLLASRYGGLRRTLRTRDAPAA